METATNKSNFLKSKSKNSEKECTIIMESKTCGVINMVSVNKINQKHKDKYETVSSDRNKKISFGNEESLVDSRFLLNVKEEIPLKDDKFSIVMEGKSCHPNNSTKVKEKKRKSSFSNDSATDESICKVNANLINLHKPVITAAANTNKPIKLEPRNNSKKKSGKLKDKEKSESSKEEINKANDENFLKAEQTMNLRVAPSSIQMTPSTLNIGKSLQDRLKSFARMDVEFYNIINNMDKKENDNHENYQSKQNDEIEIVTNVFDLDDQPEIVIDGKSNPECIINVVEFDVADDKCGQGNPLIMIDDQTSNETETKNFTFNSSNVQINPTDLLSNNQKNSIILNNPGTSFIKNPVDGVVDKTDLDFGKHNVQSNLYVSNLRDPMLVSGSRLGSRCGSRQGSRYGSKDANLNEDFERSETVTSLFQRIPTEELIQMEKALEIMKVEVNVSSEDILNVAGDKMPLKGRNLSSTKERKINNVKPVDRKNTVHQFCTSYKPEELDLYSKTVSRYSHAPSQYTVLKPRIMKDIEDSRFEVAELNDDELNDDELNDKADISSSMLLRINNLNDENFVEKTVNEEESSFSVMAQRVMDKVYNEKSIELEDEKPETFELDNDLAVGISGEKIEAKDDLSRYFNTFYPPKFNITPQIMIDKLTPKYVSVLDNENEITEESIQDDIDSDMNNTTVYDTMSADEQAYKERIVNRKHNSVLDINKLDSLNSNGSDDEYDDQSEQNKRFMSVLDLRRKKNKERPSSAFSISIDGEKSKPVYIRSLSQPNLILREQVENPFTSDYNSVMQETNIQCEQLNIIKHSPQSLESSFVNKKTESNLDSIRKQVVLSENIRTLTRSMSMEKLNKNGEIFKLSRSKSDTVLNSLDKEIILKVKSQNIDLNKWLKEEYWYKWFDELFPPNNNFDDISISGRSAGSLSPSDCLSQHIDVLPKGNPHFYDIVHEEIDSLSKRINKMNSSSGLLGFHLCRRGACYRRIGELKNALDDLCRAIELEPKLSDAYWHRHLVYLIQNNTKKALEDLSRVTLYNPNHTGAHRSRAEIYKQKGESNFAISGYNQAIVSDPKNAELYYARAELLEQRGELLLAVDDYRSADLYEPDNTLAIKKIGLYHFTHQLWMITVNDFTALIKKQASKQATAEAHLYRGRAWANLGKFHEAINDLSISITLQPGNYLSFYYRGCYLRKCMPKKALQDFSVSLLLNSTIENVDCFFHRGILYTDLKRFDQAMCDFQHAVRLNPKIAAAHVNLGIIEMKHNRNVHLAVKRFNVALKMDPTYLRAILCRAEAAEKVNNINAAIRDYTRAIHMKPECIDLRMSRGRLLLKKDQLELASFHIRQCAVMDDGKNSSPTQKATVQTFLKNYDYAVNVLESAVKSTPIVHLFGLLGRTKMKAKLFKEAIVELNHALKFLEPWDVRQSWPKESAEIFFLVGVCRMELKEYKAALDSFNISLKTNPTFAEGYFKRGLVRMKLGVSKGVSDFNKALSFRPDYYQAYLARATYYGMNKRPAKAIMNCNEAIKIEKESIRAYLYRGAIKYNIKAYSLAIKDLTQAINMDSSCALAYFNRAVCFHEKKYYFHALKDYSIVLMFDSNLQMKALLNRGLLYYRIGDIGNAVHDFDSALQADPDNPKLHHTLGLCYHKLGSLQQSLESYTNAIKVDPFFSTAYLGRGNVLIDYNQKLGTLLGRRDYLRALHMNPLCMEARVNLAYSLQMEGRFKKAWNLFTRAIEIDPKCKAALEGRALVNLQMSNTFGAFVDMNSALNISKTAESLTLRGVVNQFLNDLVSAMNDYRSAKELDPTFSLAYYNAANLYFLHRQMSQAIAFYSKAIDWNPTDGAAILNRAVARLIHKDYDGAFKDFATVEKLYPHWSHIYFNRGYQYYLTEKYELAEKDFTRALILQSNDPLIYKKRADARGKIGEKDLALLDYKRSVHLQMLHKSK